MVHLFLLDTLSNFRHFYTFLIRGLRCSQFIIKLYEVNSELLLIEPHTTLTGKAFKAMVYVNTPIS